MKVLTAVSDVRAFRASRKGSLALVPTMGALHAGHLSLVARARKENEHVAASIFVNPAQFGPAEDFAAYPRALDTDLGLLASLGVDAVWTPSASEVYPPGFQTWIAVEEVSAPLEGLRRPGHFRGVTTVVAKLLNVFQPERAYFGQKDAQQVAVLRRMILDLNLELELRVLPTVRDADGVAFSSRNARLSPEDRERARALHRALATKDAERARELLSDLDVDYVEVADFEPRVLAAAVRVGKTRLIDNVILEGDTE
jgi:pantoate--beta-alanine ligase